MEDSSFYVRYRLFTSSVHSATSSAVCATRTFALLRSSSRERADKDQAHALSSCRDHDLGLPHTYATLSVLVQGLGDLIFV